MNDTSMVDQTDSTEDLTRVGETGPQRLKSSKTPQKKQKLLENPMLITHLMESESRLVVIEWLVKQLREGNFEAHSKAEMHRRTGVSRQTLSKHVPILEKYGLVRSEGNSKPRYGIPFNDDSPLHQIMEFNNFLASKTDVEGLQELLRED